MTVLTWSDERVEELKKLWESGLSASQIAAELGNVTRNAVIGKVHRLGLSGRAKSPASAAPRQRKARPAQHMMRVARPVSRGNTALAHAFEVELEPDPVAYDNVVPMSQRLSLLGVKEAECLAPHAKEDAAGDSTRMIGRLLRRFRKPIIQRVAGAAHGADRVLLAAGVEQFAQAADMDVHGALVDIDVAAPDTIEQLLAAEHPPRMLQEKFQQPILGRAEIDRAARAGDAALLAIELDVAIAEHGGEPFRAGAAQQALHPRQ